MSVSNAYVVDDCTQHVAAAEKSRPVMTTMVVPLDWFAIFDSFEEETRKLLKHLK